MTYRRWFIVLTRPQREAQATASMRSSGYRVYEPMMRRTIIHHRTKLPLNRRFRLFHRYLFVSLPNVFEPHIGAVRNCKGVADILGFSLDGKACEISRDIVRRFMLAQRRHEFDNVIPLTKKQMAHKLPIGTRIRVRTDHRVFGGFYGQVTKLKGRGTVIAGLEMFGRLTPVELSTRDFETEKAA